MTEKTFEEQLLTELTDIRLLILNEFDELNQERSDFWLGGVTGSPFEIVGMVEEFLKLNKQRIRLLEEFQTD